MKSTNNKTVKIVAKTAEEVKKDTFETLKRNFEKAYKAGDYGKELQDLAAAVAASVLKKVIDPQRTTATERPAVSNSGVNPVMVDLRRGLFRDTHALQNAAADADAATAYHLDKDGYMVREVVDKDAAAALDAIMEETLTDGIDLAQEAALAILEQAAEHAAAAAWLDTPYNVRRLAKKVLIGLEDSAAYREEETTPMQEAYRAVRRAIQNSRAVQTDPRNGYIYIEDLTADGLETIYHRMGKHSDLAGRDCYGHYTAAMEDVKTVDDILAALGLTDRQASIVALRMRGYGYKAIASYLGVTQANINVTLYRLREKCEKIGFTPAMWADMTEE